MDGTCAANTFAETGLSLAGSTLLTGGSARQDYRSQIDSPPAFRGYGDRPSVFPSDLLSIFCSQADTDGAKHRAWWLVHTLPRQEKALAAALYSREVAFYLPLVARKSMTRGRTRTAHIALFPGYLFVCGNEEDRVSVLKTNRALTVRRAPNDDQLRTDLRRFSELIALGAPLLPEAKLVAGERVRVKSGLFRNQEGVVIRRNGKTRLMIAVDYLQQGASLEVDDCLLESV